MANEAELIRRLIMRVDMLEDIVYGRVEAGEAIEAKPKKPSPHKMEVQHKERSLLEECRLRFPVEADRGWKSTAKNIRNRLVDMRRGFCPGKFDRPSTDDVEAALVELGFTRDGSGKFVVPRIGLLPEEQKSIDNLHLEFEI